MKECDIFGAKTYSDPSYTFSGRSGPRNPQDLRPWTWATNHALDDRISHWRRTSDTNRMRN